MMRERRTAVAITALLAVFVAAGLQFSGGYYALATGILGGIAAVAAAALFTVGLVPSRPAVFAASMLVALGTWSVVSTAWGGLPHVSWRFAGLMLAAASALVVGSSLGAHARAVVGGVLAGITVHAITVLATVGLRSAPADWFRDRQLEGSIGYHNAEATIYAMGIPLAFWLATSPRRSERAAGSAVAVLFLSAALLTQSRGSLLAIVLAGTLQLALARRARLAALGVVLAIGGVMLFLALRGVDRALIADRFDDTAFTHYFLFALLISGVVGTLSLISLPPLRVSRRQKRSALAVGIAAVVTVTAIGISTLAPRVGELRGPVTPDSNPVPAAAGTTRLASFSASGRIELWEVAYSMVKEKPAAGYGAGSFTPRFTIDRTNKDLYVLQPHSLVMEMLAELGIGGLGLLLAVIAGVTAGVVRGVHRDRAVGAAVAGSLFAFLLVASVDWVYSFAGLVMPAMLIAGAAAGQRTRAVPSAPTVIGCFVALLAVLGVLAGPAVAQYQLDRARSEARDSTGSAWDTAASARSWNRWDPVVVAFQGTLAERDGRFREAAALYRKAATLSPRPWIHHYSEAQVVERLGLRSQSRAACRRASAANPLEPALWGGACDGSG